MCLLVAVLLSASMLSAWMVHSDFHGTISADFGTQLAAAAPVHLLGAALPELIELVLRQD